MMTIGVNTPVLALAGLVAGASIGCGGSAASLESAQSAASKEVLVPAGRFIAGADCDRNRVEPQCDRSFRVGRRSIALDAFVADRDLVTRGEYALCVRAGACADDLWPFASETARVLYDGADAYCRWRGAALPTPDQFERLARGTDGRVSPWGKKPSPCRDSRPSPECLSYEGPAGARSVAFNPQWVTEGLIRGGSEFAYEALDPSSLSERARYASFRCVRPYHP